MATGTSIDHIATVMGSICRTSRSPGTNAAPTWSACAPKTAAISGQLLLKWDPENRARLGAAVEHVHVLEQYHQE